MRQFRMVHVGVAAALAAAAVASVGLIQSVGAAGSGTASVLVPIVPCRLFDTRASANNVGTRNTPIGPGETATFAVWGSNGNCIIPSSATGIATNATAVHPTADSYVTIYPADASPRPTASNLNVVAGSPPTPNQVTVGLSAAGAIGVYNNGGTVDLVIDIVGYYQAASTSSGGAQGPPGPQGPQGIQGAKGDPGVTATVTRRVQFTFPANNGATGQVLESDVQCLAGERLVGGGYEILESTSVGGQPDTIVLDSRPATASAAAPANGAVATGWFVQARRNVDTVAQNVVVYVICAQTT